jgi:cytoskeletal protein CcmA (bactofilin family)
VFNDKLPASEGLIIEGYLKCGAAHHEKKLAVGRNARVKADIHANVVIVLGQLIGDIHSDGMITLAGGCVVRGNIYCSALVIEDGARFTGKIDMTEPPRPAPPPHRPVNTDVLREKGGRPYVAKPGIYA